MQVAVKAAALAPLRDDGEVRLGHEAHEQQDVDVARLAARDRPSREGEKIPREKDQVIMPNHLTLSD